MKSVILFLVLYCGYNNLCAAQPEPLPSYEQVQAIIVQQLLQAIKDGNSEAVAQFLEPIPHGSHIAGLRELKAVASGSNRICALELLNLYEESVLV